MKEKEINNEMMLEFTKLDARLFRNNVGMLKDKRGRAVKYGLCTGSSDLIGWTRIKITPEMVGNTVAIFTGIEVKAGRTVTSDAQKNFRSAVEKAGGIGMIVRSVDEAITALKTRLGL